MGNHKFTLPLWKQKFLYILHTTLNHKNIIFPHFWNQDTNVLISGFFFEFLVYFFLLLFFQISFLAFIFYKSYICKQSITSIKDYLKCKVLKGVEFLFPFSVYWYSLQSISFISTQTLIILKSVLSSPCVNHFRFKLRDSVTLVEV